MREDVDDIKAIFWKIMREEFPGLDEAIQPLERDCIRVFQKGDQRGFERACTRFLEAHADRGWRRYDAYLAQGKRDDPRIPEMEEGEIVADADFREAGKLLAHRVVIAFYQAEKRRRCLAEIRAYPYWRLRVIEDSATPLACIEESRTAYRYNAPYWQAKALPCGRLFCRCTISRQENEKG